MSIKSVMPSNHLILCCPLLLPSVFPSIRVFSSKSVLPIRWPKYWSFSFSISSSNEDSGLISFRMDWLDLLAVQETLKSLLQHHRSKASILRHSAFFRIQLSNPYTTTGKTIALTTQTFVGNVMSLLEMNKSGKLGSPCPHQRPKTQRCGRPADSHQTGVNVGPTCPVPGPSVTPRPCQPAWLRKCWLCSPACQDHPSCPHSPPPSLGKRSLYAKESETECVGS